MKTTLRGALLPFLTLALTAVLAAQPGMPFPELQEYKLEIEKLAQMKNAQINLNKLAIEKPEVAARAKQGLSAGTPGQAPTIDQIVKVLESAGPEVTEAISSTGISTRDFLLTSMSLMQAVGLSMMEKQGREIPAGIPTHNLDFVKQHESEIQALMNELRGSAAPPQK